MLFADLKNDFVFRRIFATHPDILRRLLNDLLDRQGDRTIEGIEYLSSAQSPAVACGKLSVLNAYCKDRAGVTFVVKVQLIHHEGFIKKAVERASLSYVMPPEEGAPCTGLVDVVVISFCEFELWPDAQQDTQNLPRVPMLSRWNMTEQKSGSPGLLQVQHVFLELPKLPKSKPEIGAAYWAWLSVHAPELTEIPSELSEGPYRDALELANQAKFTQLEMQAYEKVHDEIRQVFEIAAARWAEGFAEGLAEGLAESRAEREAQFTRPPR